MTTGRATAPRFGLLVAGRDSPFAKGGPFFIDEGRQFTDMRVVAGTAGSTLARIYDMLIVQILLTIAKVRIDSCIFKP